MSTAEPFVGRATRRPSWRERAPRGQDGGGRFALVAAEAAGATRATGSRGTPGVVSDGRAGRLNRRCAERAEAEQELRIVSVATGRGNSADNQLTNQVAFARRPAMRRGKSACHEPEFASEWIEICAGVVRLVMDGDDLGRDVGTVEVMRADEVVGERRESHRPNETNPATRHASTSSEKGRQP